MMSSAPGGAWEVVDVSTGPNSWDVANARCRQLRYTLAAPSSGDVRLTAQLAPQTVVWPSGSVFYGHKGGVSALGTETNVSPFSQTGDVVTSLGPQSRRSFTSMPPSSPLAQLPIQAMIFAW